MREHERIEGVLSEKDEGEDAMVDVVGSDPVGLECVQKEIENCDQDMVDVAGSGEDCDGSGGVRVLSYEKDEVVVNKGEVAVSGEARVLSSEKVEVVVDEEDMVDVMGLGEDCDASVGIRVLGSEKDEFVGDNNNQSSAAEVVSSRTDEVVETVIEDGMHPTIEVIADDVQETTNGDRVVNEKTEKENEVLDSKKIAEPLVTVNLGSEDADVAVKEDIPVDPSLVEDEINVNAENVDQQAEVDNLSEKESFNPTVDVITETDVMVKEKTEASLTKNEEIKEQPTEPVQVVAYENGVMDDKTGKVDEIVESSKIPESLTTVNLGLEENNTVTPITDADMDRVDDAGMHIDEVMGWKDEVQGVDITANCEANVEQKLPESSSEPVLIKHQDEHIKSREPIVYGRRAHVDVPLYESRKVEQNLPEPSSLVSEDENLKIETYSEQDDDDDEYMQEDDPKEGKQKPELLETGNLFSLHQSSYFKPPENEGDFSVSDLVWGKVRSHPWWPGQIIDPSNASKKAIKYYKKDCFLVAYFGDHSFAWNNPSVLTPFRAVFSQYANQTDTEIFKIAVNCALEEVSRRVELGLACSCIPKQIYKKIEYQVTENGGVRKKSCKMHGKDESALVSSFEPDKLVDYVRSLAQFPAQGDNLDLAITKAQLSSYGHYKGHRELPEFLNCGDMLEELEAPVHEPVDQVCNDGEKIENDLIDTANPNKEIGLSDVTDDAPTPIHAPESVGGTRKPVSSSGLKKRKACVSISNGSVKRQGRTPNKVVTAPVSTPTPTPTPKPSFKIGEMIQRVASQLTGPPSVPKVDHGQQVEQTVNTPENSQVEASAADMLSQLCLTAQDPMKEYGFHQTIIPFFYERRAAVFSKSLKKPVTVEKPNNDMEFKPPNENDPEEFDFDFDFDDINDSYWTDRIIQNHSEDQPMQDNQDNKNGVVEEYPIVVHEPEKPAKRRRRLNKKEKRAVSNNHKPEPEPEPEPEVESEVDRTRRENLATEVILKFEEGINFRSEVQLSKMFKRFGPLMESETEVDQAGGRARVVFKKCFDAEVAHNSAGTFNIFGSVNVSYELNYSPLVSYKPLPLPLPVLQEDLLPVQEDPQPVVQEDPQPVVQEGSLPMLQKVPLPVQEVPQPVLQEDPLPVLQEEPIPMSQDDPMDES